MARTSRKQIHQQTDLAQAPKTYLGGAYAAFLWKMTATGTATLWKTRKTLFWTFKNPS